MATFVLFLITSHVKTSTANVFQMYVDTVLKNRTRGKDKAPFCVVVHICTGVESE